MLNCCMKSAVSNSWAQNQKMKICWYFVMSERRTATYRNNDNMTHHKMSPNHSGTTAKGAMISENSGP